MNIAIISPHENAYSESFIQAHRKYLKGKIFFVYGGEQKFYNGQPLNAPHTAGRSFVRRVINVLKRNLLGMASPFIPHNALEQFFIDYAIDVVIAEYGNTGVQVLKSCIHSHIPLIVNFFGYEAAEHRILQLYKQGYHRLIDHAYAITSVSESIKKTLHKEIGLPTEKIQVNYPGATLREQELKKNISKKPVFIAIGRFVEKKAPHKTIFAFQKVQQQIPEAKLQFIGDGILLDACKDIVAAMQLEEHVAFLGAVAHEELEQYMAEAIACVQHSIRPVSGDMEGTPVVVLEAMAAGLPIVSTRHAGIKEVVVEGECGLLCDPGDINQMAQQMIALVKHPERAQQMGKAGRERVKQQYTMERHIAFLQDIVERAHQQKTKKG